MKAELEAICEAYAANREALRQFLTGGYTIREAEDEGWD